MMKNTDEIHESFLAPGVKFTLRDMSSNQVLKLRRKYLDITGMMWICDRAKISYGYLEQGHTLIMIWKN